MKSNVDAFLDALREVDEGQFLQEIADKHAESVRVCRGRNKKTGIQISMGLKPNQYGQVELLALVKRFGDPDRALVLLQAKPSDLLNGQPTVVTAYFDIGYSGHVGWADWNAVLRLEPVSALKRLLAFVKTGGDHKALVRLLDSLVPYLVEPSAAVIHDAFMKLNLTKQVQFKRAEDLANGDVVLSVETVTGAQTEAGRVRLPETVSFSLPVFVGMAAVWELEFKLRYQLKDESCTFRLECDDLEDQAASLLGAILEELQSTFNGSAQVVAGSM